MDYRLFHHNNPAHISLSPLYQHFIPHYQDIIYIPVNTDIIMHIYQILAVGCFSIMVVAIPIEPAPRMRVQPE